MLYPVRIRSRFWPADSSPMDRSLYDGTVSLLTLNNTTAELVAQSPNSETAITYAALGGMLNAADVYLLNLGIDPDDATYISYFEGFRVEGDKTVTPPSDPFAGDFDVHTSGGILLPGMTACNLCRCSRLYN